MSNNTSTAPIAFNAVYGLLKAAGNQQTPRVEIFHSLVVQREPANYVLLESIENHRWEWSSLGTFAFEEDYDITGYASVLSGKVDPSEVLMNTYAMFQTVVQTPIIQHRAYPVLSDEFMNAGGLEIIPGYSRYVSEPGVSGGGGVEGFFGKVEFSYHVRARVTVP